MNCKHAPELVLAAINAGTYDPAEGCRWPRDVIAAYTELCEKTVSRATAQLEAEGRLKVHRPRKRGECNTYFVGTWNPPLRKRTIARLKETKPAVRRLRESKCPPNRTAASSRARTAVASTETRALLPRCTQLKHQRCGREARIEIRRSSMEQRRRHLHVADLACLHCQEKDAELERLQGVVRKYAESETKRAEEVSGAYDTIRAQGKEITRLRRDITRQANESARAELIEKVVEHWRYRRPKASSAFGKPGSRSYQVIEKALALMADDEKGPVLACCEAIDGLHLARWESYGKRYAKPGPNRTQRDTIDYALGDEQKIERCRGILRKVRGGGAQRAWEQYMAVGETERAWADEVLDLLREQPAPRERFCHVDGIKTRVDS